MRSDTAFFSAADISRRFLAGLASDLLSAAAAPFVGEEERRDVERAVGADAPPPTPRRARVPLRRGATPA